MFPATHTDTQLSVLKGPQTLKETYQSMEDCNGNSEQNMLHFVSKISLTVSFHSTIV